MRLYILSRGSGVPRTIQRYDNFTLTQFDPRSIYFTAMGESVIIVRNNTFGLINLWDSTNGWY